MANSFKITKQSLDLDPTFLLPRPKIRRRTIRKAPPEIPVGDVAPEEIDSENYIQCINCLDVLPGDVIDSHRKVCSTFVDINISSQGALQSSQSQVLKFGRYLENLLKNPSLESSDVQLLRLLLEGTEKLNKRETNYSEVSELHESTKTLLDSYKGIASLRIFIERFQSLIKTHINILQHNTLEGRKNKMNHMKNQLNRLRNNKLSNSSMLDLKISKGKIEEINSQIKSKKASSGKFSQSEAVLDNKITFNIRDESYENSLQCFYSICIKIKMQMDAFSPAQAVPISFLYEQANAKHVKVDDWPDFVTEQLGNPANWAKAAKTTTN